MNNKAAIEALMTDAPCGKSNMNCPGAKEFRAMLAAALEESRSTTGESTVKLRDVQFHISAPDEFRPEAHIKAFHLVGVQTRGENSDTIDMPAILFEATPAEVEDFARRLLDQVQRAKRQRHPNRRSA